MAQKGERFNVGDPTWLEVMAWANGRLAMHRRSLEVPGTSHQDTEGLRYAIAELEALLKFPNPSRMSVNVSETQR